MPASGQRRDRRRAWLLAGRAVVGATAGVIGAGVLGGPAAGHAAPAGIQFKQAVSLRMPTGTRFASLGTELRGRRFLQPGRRFTGRSGASHMMVITRSNGNWALPTKLRLPPTGSMITDSFAHIFEN
jgi:hypothetical protein